MASSSSNYSNSDTRVVPGMMGVYNQLLGLNQQNYNRVISGYNQGQNLIAQRLSQIEPGYAKLGQQVMRQLGVGGGGWGVAAPAARDIQGSLERTLGETDQRMISSGLGATTVRANMRGQAASQAARAYGALGADLAKTAAGYLTQIGLAGQAARMQGLGLQAGYSQHGLGVLGNYQFRNTAGDLTGSFHSGGGSSSSVDSGGGGYGRGGGGTSGSAMGGLGHLFGGGPNFYDQPLGYSPGRMQGYIDPNQFYQGRSSGAQEVNMGQEVVPGGYAGLGATRDAETGETDVPGGTFDDTAYA
jgi:hypothetical protein